MTRLEFTQVDAFAESPFTGNPAAICIVPRFPSEAWMQAVAAENNLSETAFVTKKDRDFELRWFTPEAEVDLCGHATLACAHLLWEQEVLAKDEVARFHTRSGLLTATRRGDWIELDFPRARRQTVQGEDEARLATALGTSLVCVETDGSDMLAELSDASVLRELKPNQNLLAEIACRGIIVTSKSDRKGEDFLSRFFAPRHGIPEDPVTGSAHCFLTPFWADRLGKNEMVAYQASRRGGTVGVTLKGDRVLLRGRAVSVMRSTWLADVDID